MILDVTKDAVSVRVTRVEYDLDAAVRAIRASELPDEFAEQLRVGENRHSIAAVSER